MQDLAPSVSRSRRLRAAAKIFPASCVAAPSERARVRSLKSAALSFSVTVEPARDPSLRRVETFSAGRAAIACIPSLVAFSKRAGLSRVQFKAKHNKIIPQSSRRNIKFWKE
jgi:hypothetical protein